MRLATLFYMFLYIINCMNFTVRDVTLRSLTTFVVFSFVFLFAGCAGLFDETPPDSGACGMEYRPVCGVNNQVYLNPCFANRSGVVVANEGECRPTASCDDNFLGRSRFDSRLYC